jgi:thiamine pyrophosphokinase
MGARAFASVTMLAKAIGNRLIHSLLSLFLAPRFAARLLKIMMMSNAQIAATINSMPNGG